MVDFQCEANNEILSLLKQAATKTNAYSHSLQTALSKACFFLDLPHLVKASTKKIVWDLAHWFLHSALVGINR